MVGGAAPRSRISLRTPRAAALVLGPFLHVHLISSILLHPLLAWEFWVKLIRSAMKCADADTHYLPRRELATRDMQAQNGIITSG